MNSDYKPKVGDVCQFRRKPSDKWRRIRILFLSDRHLVGEGMRNPRWPTAEFAITLKRESEFKNLNTDAGKSK